jgi:hypothetical protein
MCSLRDWRNHTGGSRVIQVDRPWEWSGPAKCRSIEAYRRKRPERDGIGITVIRRYWSTQGICTCGIRAVEVWKVRSDVGACGKGCSRVYARASREADRTDRWQIRGLGDIDTTLVAIAAPPGLTTTSAERRIAQARSMVEVGSAASIRPGSIRIAPIENTRAVILFAPTRHQSCCRS